MGRAAFALVVFAFASGVVFAGEPHDLHGKVTNGKKKAVKAAVVLVRVKAWPGGRFAISDHDAVSDTKGRFRLEEVVPADSRYGAWLSVVTPGRALVTQYLWSDTPKAPDAIALDAPPAHPVRMRVVSDGKEALKGTRMFPVARITPTGDRHGVGSGRRDAAIVDADGSGVMDASFFEVGDWATVEVFVPGFGWSQREFLVPAKLNALVDVPNAAPVTPVADLKAGEDEKKRYFLMGPKPGDTEPEDGYGLVLVMPGGDGSADFHGFVRERYADWVGGGFVFAQLVAPKWTAEQAIVWPTETSPETGMEFTTEAFVDAVVKDASGRVKIDPTRVYGLVWSSSGPGMYRMLTLEDSPVRGAVMAMSVFFRSELDKLANVKGRAVYILHSPDDEVCKPFHATMAAKTLKKKGALVESATYEGGHGWQGDSMDLARKGIYWIDAQRK